MHLSFKTVGGKEFFLEAAPEASVRVLAGFQTTHTNDE